MKAKKLVLRCYAKKADNQWSAVCLDFTLAAQADTFEEARQKLNSMICEYVYDALVGEDKEHADYFLNRRAPLINWVQFYLIKSVTHFNSMKEGIKRTFSEPIPLVPNNCQHGHKV